MLRCEVGILHGAPDQLQDPALLRVHAFRLARGDPIHRVIDIQGVVNDTGRERVGFADNPDLGVPITRLVPAIIWYLGDCILSLTK